MLTGVHRGNIFRLYMSVAQSAASRNLRLNTPDPFRILRRMQELSIAARGYWEAFLKNDRNPRHRCFGTCVPPCKFSQLTRTSLCYPRLWAWILRRYANGMVLNFAQATIDVNFVAMPGGRSTKANVEACSRRWSVH